MSDNSLLVAGQNRYGKLFHNSAATLDLNANNQVSFSKTRLLPHVDLIKHVFDSDSSTILVLNQVYCFGVSFAADDTSTICSGHGKCIGEDTCQCDVGFVGAQCQNQVFCNGIAVRFAFLSLIVFFICLSLIFCLLCSLGWKPFCLQRSRYLCAK